MRPMPNGEDEWASLRNALADTGPPPPKPDDELATLRAELDAARARIAELEAELARRQR